MNGVPKVRTNLEVLKIKLYRELQKKNDKTDTEQQQLKWLKKYPELGGWVMDTEKGFM